MSVARLKDLVEYAGEDRVISSIEMDAMLQKKQNYLINVKSKIPTLDKYIEGFCDGELIAVSGLTKNGKTLLCQSFTVNFIEQQHFPLWFTFEVPPKQFLSQFSDLPHIYMPSQLRAKNMDWVEERILESYAKYNSRIIFIDHLHYLFDMMANKNTSLTIGNVVRRLKGIAVQNNFVIFLLCHTAKGRSDEDQSYESIRDSSFVAQESDTVFMVKRTPDVAENAARMRVEFHRRTGVMEKVVYLQKQGKKLVERVPKTSEVMND